MPVRYKTQGYTGDTNKRQKVYDKKEVLAIINRLKSVFNEPITDSLEFNQFMRAEVFVFMDASITSNNRLEWAVCESLFEAYVISYCKWLREVKRFGAAVVCYLTFR